MFPVLDLPWICSYFVDYFVLSLPLLQGLEIKIVAKERMGPGLYDIENMILFF